MSEANYISTTCSACRHYHKLTTGGETFKECRRFPKVYAPNYVDRWQFPRVQENDFCGEFSEQNTKDQERD